MKKAPSHHKKLGQFFSTAICGNDILSSTLYVTGIAALFAGTYAPIALLLVGAVLLLYRQVYREVVEALPVNGGVYNALLNSTSKAASALAGTLTVLSYIATAVISAKTAVEYLFRFLGQIFPSMSATFDSSVTFAVIAVLFLFAVLVVVGVSESAVVAAGIFSLHIVTLLVFLGAAIVALATGVLPSVWAANATATAALVSAHGGLAPVLFLAFSASLLGVSGFESSANFVEEQAPGVFPKTLRNMTAGVLFFNPMVALMILQVMSLAGIIAAKDFVIAEAATSVGGTWLLALVAIDAFLVLCGAVLTSFVGVKGLAYRLTIDACLPSVLISKNPNQPRIIFGFFAFCVSILLLTKGDLLSLAGVYTISFLSVMTSFALANLILRKNRPDLNRPYKASLVVVILAASATAAGLVGNILIDVKNVQFFLTYFIPAATVVLLVIYKKEAYHSAARLTWFHKGLHRFFKKKFEEAAKDRIYIFLRTNTLVANALDYVSRNESATHITFIHCEEGNKTCTIELEQILANVRKAGFYPKLQLDVLCLPEQFSDKTLDKFSKRHHVPKHKIFMGSIHTTHGFTYQSVGGVRIIS